MRGYSSVALVVLAAIPFVAQNARTGWAAMRIATMKRMAEAMARLRIGPYPFRRSLDADGGNWIEGMRRSVSVHRRVSRRIELFVEKDVS
jgi:hypothetical protein